MLSFEPKALNLIKEQIKTKFQLPENIENEDDSSVSVLMQKLRKKEIAFVEMPESEFCSIYGIAKLCSESEFSQLKDVFQNRMNGSLYDAGWVYCQSNPNDDRATQLFSLACEWMRSYKPEIYEQTLIGRTGIAWGDVYIRSIEIMRLDKITIDEFVKKYSIIPGSLFYNHLRMTYFANCNKSEFEENIETFAGLISHSSLELLRPAIANYTSKFDFNQMDPFIYTAIVERIELEKTDETLGFSPSVLQKFRQRRFEMLISNLMGQNFNKLDFYKKIIEKIRNIESLQGNFIMLHIGKYMIVENPDWDNFAYAYLPKLYQGLFETWTGENYSEDFWPGVEESEIAFARDIVISQKRSSAIKLLFDGFDLLYTRDLLFER